MWVALGKESEKIYAKGDYRMEVLRKINKKYPYKYSDRFEEKIIEENVLPEPLILTKGAIK